MLTADEARQLLDSIDTGTLIGMRDRALIGVMGYSFARVNAALGMRVDRTITWRAARRGSACTRRAASGTRCPPTTTPPITWTPTSPPPASPSRRKDPSSAPSPAAASSSPHRPLDARNALDMIKRRAQAIGLPTSICCHTFRATGITAYRANGGTLENAQEIANHASPKTTKLYDRTSDQITLDEVERIMI